MVTVSMPIYYTENGTRFVLGVAGIDVLMEQFEALGLNETQTVTELIKDVTCYKRSLTDCEMNQLRESGINFKTYSLYV